MEKSFELFLLENEILHKFIYNLKKYAFNPNWSIRNIPKDDYIILSFDWDKTAQGRDFWENINKKWLNKLYN